MQFPGFDWLSSHGIWFFYHAREIATVKLSSGCSSKAESARSSNMSAWLFLIKQLRIPLAPVGYELIIASMRLGGYLTTRACGMIVNYILLTVGRICLNIKTCNLTRSFPFCSWLSCIKLAYKSSSESAEARSRTLLRSATEARSSELSLARSQARSIQWEANDRLSEL